MSNKFLRFSHTAIAITSKHWANILSGLLLAVSSMSVAQANAANHIDEDCWRVLASCETVLSEMEKEAAQSFESASTLAVTDFNHYATYKIEFQGSLEASTNKNEFIAQVSETLSDDRGWLRAGYVFNRVQVAAQADFILILIQAELLDTIPGCSSQWSCRSGSHVYINEDRWNNATAAWNNAGGSLRDYRHMVVNHEVGHWLGHGHYNCSDSPSNLAPVMQQQSIDLQGCKFNPWPLEFEIAAV